MGRWKSPPLQSQAFTALRTSPTPTTTARRPRHRPQRRPPASSQPPRRHPARLPQNPHPPQRNHHPATGKPQPTTHRRLTPDFYHAHGFRQPQGADLRVRPRRGGDLRTSGPVAPSAPERVNDGRSLITAGAHITVYRLLNQD